MTDTHPPTTPEPQPSAPEPPPSAPEAPPSAYEAPRGAYEDPRGAYEDPRGAYEDPPPAREVLPGADANPPTAREAPPGADADLPGAGEEPPGAYEDPASACADSSGASEGPAAAYDHAGGGDEGPGGGYEGAMRRALVEARVAGAAGDVPVGAVVLDGAGEVIAAGHNDRERTGDPTGHAEVVALRAAAAHLGTWRLSGCTLVVTLEPCTMCAGAAVLARVERLVYGAVDLKAGAVGSLWDVVRDRRLNHRPEVISEVLAGECGALLSEFFASRRVG